MVSFRPLRIGLFPFQMAFLWLINVFNGGDPNYLHPLGWSSKYEPMYINQHLPFRVSMKNPNKWWFDTLQTEPKLGSSNPSIPWRIPRSALKWWCIFFECRDATSLAMVHALSGSRPFSELCLLSWCEGVPISSKKDQSKTIHYILRPA